MGLRACSLYGVDIEREEILNKKRLPKKLCHLHQTSIKVSSVSSSQSEFSTNYVKDEEFFVSPTERSWLRSSAGKCVKVKSCHVKFNTKCGKSNNSLFIPYSSPHDSSSSSFYTWPIPISKILPHLYLGAYDNAIDEVELKAKNITHILSLIGHRSPLGFVKHEHFPMNDHGQTDVKQVLAGVSEFIKQGQKDGNNVLVHCQSGQNRSPTLVLAYLMMNHKKTLWRAHREVKKLRPLVQINKNYAKQLLKLEKEIFHENSLPPEWMERGQFDEESGTMLYKYEHMNTVQHLEMFKSDNL